MSVTGLPAGLTLRTQNGGQRWWIDGTPVAAAFGPHTVTLTASADGTSIARTFTWTIVNRPPTISTFPAQSSTVGQVVSLQFHAVDPDGDPLRFIAAGLPPGVGLDARTGLVSGRATLAGSYAVSIAVTDGMLAAASSFSWTVVAVPPHLVSIGGVQPRPAVEVRNVKLEGGVAGAVTAMSAIRWNEGYVANGTAGGALHAPDPVTFELGAATSVDQSWLTAQLTAGMPARDVSVVARTARGHVNFRVVLKDARPAAWSRDPLSGRVVTLTLTSRVLEILTLDDSIAPKLLDARPRLVVNGTAADMMSVSGGALTTSAVNPSLAPHVTPLAFSLVRPVAEVVAWLQNANAGRSVTLEQRPSAQAAWSVVNTYADAAVTVLTLFDPDQSVDNGSVIAWPSFVVQPSAAGKGGSTSIGGVAPARTIDVRGVTLEGGLAGAVDAMSALSGDVSSDTQTGAAGGRRVAPGPVTFRLGAATFVDESWLSAQLTAARPARDVTVVARNAAGHVNFRVVLKEARPGAWTRDPASGRVVMLTLTATHLDTQTLDDTVAPPLPAARPRLVVNGSPADMASASGGALVSAKSESGVVRTSVEPLELSLVRPVPEVLTWLQTANGVRDVTLEQRSSAQAPWILVNNYGGATVVALSLFDPDRSLDNGFVVAWPSLTLLPTSAGANGSVAIDGTAAAPTVNVRSVRLEGGLAGAVSAMSAIRWSQEPLPQDGAATGIFPDPVPVTFRLEPLATVDESWLSAQLTAARPARNVTIAATNDAGHENFRIVLEDARPGAWTRDPATGRVTTLTLTSHSLKFLTLDDTVGPKGFAGDTRMAFDGITAEMAVANGGAWQSGVPSPTVGPLTLSVVRPAPDVVTWLQQAGGVRTITLEQLQPPSTWVVVNTYVDCAVRFLTLFDPANSVNNGYVVAWPSVAVQPGSVK
jgi:hypothetical protein